MKITTNEQFTILGGIVTINGFVNKKLMEQSKTLKRNFSNEFKNWFIWMKANFDGSLYCSGDENDWWWMPAMRIRIPGIKFKGIDY